MEESSLLGMSSPAAGGSLSGLLTVGVKVLETYKGIGTVGNAERGKLGMMVVKRRIIFRNETDVN